MHVRGLIAVEAVFLPFLGQPWTWWLMHVIVCTLQACNFFTGAHFVYVAVLDKIVKASTPCWFLSLYVVVGFMVTVLGWSFEIAESRTFDRQATSTTYFLRCSTVSACTGFERLVQLADFTFVLLENQMPRSPWRDEYLLKSQICIIHTEIPSPGVAAFLG